MRGMKNVCLYLYVYIEVKTCALMIYIFFLCVQSYRESVYLHVCIVSGYEAGYHSLLPYTV